MAGYVEKFRAHIIFIDLLYFLVELFSYFAFFAIYAKHKLTYVKKWYSIWNRKEETKLCMSFYGASTFSLVIEFSFFV